MIVPDCCLPLLKEQRTHYHDIRREYGSEIARTFDTFADLLPERVEHILDIGSGMAGIDVALGKAYPGAALHLLDKQGVSPAINAGFNATADAFAHYNDFSAALALLAANGIENTVVCHDMNVSPFPARTFDVVVSLLSWGFHYPISAYAPKCSGLIVADVRKGTDGERQLARYGATQVVHEGRKYRRVAVQCG